jgi:hypothetical protein
MKKLILISAMTLFSAAGFAQTAVKYCDLVVYQPNFKNFVAEMHVDGNTRPRLTKLRDAAGNKLKFATEADAVNYVARQGWEVVTAYNRNHSETHFLLKKTS